MAVMSSGKGELDAQHVEELHDSLAQQRPVHYVPRSEDERRMDKRVNLRLDLFVVSILALEFIVSPNISRPISKPEIIPILTMVTSFAESTKRTLVSSPPVLSSRMPIFLPTTFPIHSHSFRPPMCLCSQS